MTSENSGETPPASHHLHGGGTRPDQETLPCPRCNSGNTKFCYYNNYNLSQPRHFCKSCRRYWTRGGTLRNVPVGGGSRNKRPRTATTEAKPPVQIEKKVETSVTNSFFTDVDLNEMGKGCENGFDPFGNGSSGFEDLCFGEAGGSGLGDTWRGEYSFGWPDLAISSLGWGPKEC